MQPNNFPIGVLDSGVGGLTVVQEIQRQLPNENIIYFGDSKNMPYGNRQPEDIVSLTAKIISFLENNNVKAILLACNTISAQMEELVPLTETPIFDIIYPGCLAAVENDTQADGIGLIATEATVRSDIYSKTLKSLNPDISLISQGSPDLARMIEQNSEENLDQVLKETIDPLFAEKQIKNLILGCTHYPIVSQNISNLYGDLNLINPAVKLVEVVKGFLDKNDLLADGSNKGLNIYTSGGMDTFLPFLDTLGIKEYNLEIQSLD